MENIKQIKINEELHDIEDTQARADIASEVVNRTNADNALQEKINTNKTGIDNLVNDVAVRNVKAEEVTNVPEVKLPLDEVKEEIEAAGNRVLNSIPDDYTQMNNKISELKGDLDYQNRTMYGELNTLLLKDLEFVSEGYFDNTGRIVDSTTHAIVRVKCDKIINGIIESNTQHGPAFPLAIVKDSNENIIYKKNPISTEQRLFYFGIPENGEYLYLVWFYYKNPDLGYNSVKIQNKFVNEDKEIKVGYEISTFPYWGWLNYVNGELTEIPRESGNDYSYTDYIDITFIDSIRFRLPTYKGDGVNIAYMVFYDENKNILKVLTHIEDIQVKGAGVDEVYYKDIPIGAKYVRLTKQSSIGSFAVIYKSLNKVLNIKEKTFDISVSNTNTFIGACNTFIRNIIADKPNMLFVFTSPAYAQEKRDKRDDTDKICDISKALARYWGSTFIDSRFVNGLYNHNDGEGNTGEQNSYVWMKDGIHPTDVYTGDDYTLNRRTARFFADNLKYIFDDWSNKKILWVGTSVESGYPGNVSNSYPNMVANLLGCQIDNKSVAGGVMRGKKVDGTTFTNDSLINNFNERIKPYVSSYDLVIISHGLNDYVVDNTDFNIDEWQL